jgi:uncharacterized membrane protein
MNISRIVFFLLFVGYPIIVYFGLRFFEARVVAPILVLVALARWLMSRRVDGVGAQMPQTKIVIGASIVLALATELTNSQVYLEYYPLCMNVAMFTMFFGSLIRPPSVVERIARLSDPDFPEHAVAYTRKVTVVWCLFFVFNGSMALATVLVSDLAIWAIYNGVVSYALMAMLFVGEYLLRDRLLARPCKSRPA